MTAAERAYLEALSDNSTGATTDSDANMNATWITTDGVLSGGTATQLRYNVGVRNRGHGTRTSRPHNFHVNIPSDRLWKKQAGINLNSQYGYSQVLGSAIFRRVEVPMPDSSAVQVRVNGVDEMSLYNANSFGSYAANEQYNNDFVKRSWPLDAHGNSYRGIRTAAADLISSGEVTGKIFETVMLHAPRGVKAKRLLIIGGGKAKNFSQPQKLKKTNINDDWSW